MFVFLQNPGASFKNNYGSSTFDLCRDILVNNRYFVVHGASWCIMVHSLFDVIKRILKRFQSRAIILSLKILGKF